MDLSPFWMFFSPGTQMAPFKHQYSENQLIQNKYLQFSSHHPLNRKMSVVKTLFNGASFLSTSLGEQSIEERHIAQALKGKGYPT